jgi:hypothetical protein
MNKKMILSILAIAFIAFIGFGLYKANGLKSIQIVKTITVRGAKNEVFDMVKYLNNFPKWSPFLAEDPSQKYKIKGIDGTVGAQYHWDGNKGKDLGFQEIKKIEEGRSIAIQCDITKPFVAKPTFDYTFTETTNGIIVKQDFKVASGLPDAFFMWLFSAKAGMEKMNQLGLDLLKLAVEKQ